MNANDAPPLDPKVKIAHRAAVEGVALWLAILMYYEVNGAIPEELRVMLSERLAGIVHDLGNVIMTNDIPFFS